MSSQGSPYAETPYLDGALGAPLIEQAGGELTSKSVVFQLQDALARSNFYLLRRCRNAETRFNWFWGQSRDGRQHAADRGQMGCLFEGAPDTRPLTADGIINEDVAITSTAFAQSRFAEAAGLRNADWAPQVQDAVQHMTHTRMWPDIKHEFETAMNFRQTYGSAATFVGWEEYLALEERTRTMDDFLEYINGGSMNADPGMMSGMAVDEDREDEAVKAFMSWQKGIDPKTARKAVRDLREDGEATFNAPYVAGQRAVTEAMETQFDLIVPANCRKLQDARYIGKRRIFSPATLWATAEAEDWNPAFTNEVMKHPGVMMFTDWQTWVARNGPIGATRPESLYEMQLGYYEVWQVYVKRTGKNGQMGVYENLVHVSVTDVQAFDEDKLCKYTHGKYPFVEHRRERFSKYLLESRGWPEVVFTQQDEIKIQRDARATRAMMETTPPVLRRLLGTGRLKLEYGPGSINDVRDIRADVGYLALPPGGETSREVQNAAQLEVDWYTGRARADGAVSPEKSAMMQQALVNDVLAEWSEVSMMIWQLMCQYMSQEEIEAVTGPLAREWPPSNEEIRQENSLLKTFDARELNPEYIKQKMEAISEVAAQDPTGVVDQAGLTYYKMSLIDVNVARKYVKNEGDVTQKEIEDEQNTMSRMADGIPAQMKQGGVNAKLRLQTIQDTFAKSTKFQTLARSLGQEGQQFRKNLSDHVKNLQFIDQQFAPDQNKLTGKTGVKAPPSPLPQQQEAVA